MPDLEGLVLGGEDSLYFSTIKEALENRVLIFNDEVNDCILENYVFYILKWNMEDKNLPKESRTPIKILLNSPGGDAIVAFHLINIIEASKTPIIGIGTGLVASAAYYIYLSCHERIAFNDTVILQHDGSINVSHSTSKAKDVMAFFDDMEVRTKQFVLSHTTMTEEFYDDHYDTEFYMYSDKAKSFGIVDKIVGVDVDLDYIL